MKYKRIKSHDIEAHYLEKVILGKRDYLPEWLGDSIVELKKEGIVSVKTNNGISEAELPCYFIREKDDKGAYPVSVEYFEENFEEVK